MSKVKEFVHKHPIWTVIIVYTLLDLILTPLLFPWINTALADVTNVKARCESLGGQVGWNKCYVDGEER